MSSTMQVANPWLRINQPKPNARLRLFCFPYAGGAASIYRTWHQHLPPEIEVCAVQLPGRENRIRERSFTDAGELVQALLPMLLPYLDRPFALFGHSMGTLIAYEMAHELQRQQRVPTHLPTHLFVSGRRAPVLPEQEAPLHRLATDEAFLTHLQRRYQNVPAVLFEDAELRELFIPLLRADFTLVESYQYRERSPLDCPIVALGGDADPRATESDLRAWRELTRSDFALYQFPGGHFYLNEQVQSLLVRLAALLST